MVVTDLHFAEQSDRQQVQAANEQAIADHHQRTMFGHHRNVAQELLYAEPSTMALPLKMLNIPTLPKKCSGRESNAAGNDGQQIEEYAEGARDAVVRNSALTVDVRGWRLRRCLRRAMRLVPG